MRNGCTKVNLSRGKTVHRGGHYIFFSQLHISLDGSHDAASEFLDTARWNCEIEVQPKGKYLSKKPFTYGRAMCVVRATETIEAVLSSHAYFTKCAWRVPLSGFILNFRRQNSTIVLHSAAQVHDYIGVSYFRVFIPCRIFKPPRLCPLGWVFRTAHAERFARRQ